MVHVFCPFCCITLYVCVCARVCTLHWLNIKSEFTLFACGTAANTAKITKTYEKMRVVGIHVRSLYEHIHILDYVIFWQICCVNKTERRLMRISSHIYVILNLQFCFCHLCLSVIVSTLQSTLHNNKCVQKKKNASFAFCHLRDSTISVMHASKKRLCVFDAFHMNTMHTIAFIL